MMFDSCIEKQNALKQLFANCHTEDEKYAKIIELGRNLPKLPQIEKRPDLLVKGCQSQVYLHSSLVDKRVHFQADSDALISSGLAALLIAVYDRETPETILTCSPTYLEDLGIGASLTPNRANGLYAIHLRMKQDALQLYIQAQKSS